MLMTIRELHKRFKHSWYQTEQHLRVIDAGFQLLRSSEITVAASALNS
jgi:hypothetical protein